MALTGQHIVDRARRVLLDNPAVRWLDAEVLDWINDAQREIVALKPNANVVSENLALAVSETRVSQDRGTMDYTRRRMRNVETFRATVQADEPAEPAPAP